MSKRTLVRTALRNGQTMLIPGRRYWLLVQANRFVPHKVAAQAARRAQEREHKG